MIPLYWIALEGVAKARTQGRRLVCCCALWMVHGQCWVAVAVPYKFIKDWIRVDVA